MNQKIPNRGTPWSLEKSYCFLQAASTLPVPRCCQSWVWALPPLKEGRVNWPLFCLVGSPLASFPSSFPKTCFCPLQPPAPKSLIQRPVPHIACGSKSLTEDFGDAIDCFLACSCHFTMEPNETRPIICFSQNNASGFSLSHVVPGNCKWTHAESILTSY